MNLFSLKTTCTYVKLCKENAGDSGLPRKNRILGQNCQKYENFGKIFKKLNFKPLKKFSNRLFFLKTYLIYVELCQEHAGDSGLPRKNRILGQNGQKYANFGKIFKIEF